MLALGADTLWGRLGVDLLGERRWQDVSDHSAVPLLSSLAVPCLACQQPACSPRKAAGLYSPD